MLLHIMSSQKEFNGAISHGLLCHFSMQVRAQFESEKKKKKREKREKKNYNECKDIHTQRDSSDSNTTEQCFKKVFV